jgi:antitoxin MazE
MRANLVAIGNSRGVRIPKAVLEQTGLTDTVELEVRGKQLVIRSARKPREGWAEDCRKMAELGEDGLIDPQTPTIWDETEWTW